MESDGDNVSRDGLVLSGPKCVGQLLPVPRVAGERVLERWAQAALIDRSRAEGAKEGDRSWEVVAKAVTEKVQRDGLVVDRKSVV